MSSLWKSCGNYKDTENYDENCIRLFNEILAPRETLEEEERKEEKERMKREKGKEE